MLFLSSLCDSSTVVNSCCKQCESVCVFVRLWMKQPAWMPMQFAAAVDMAQRVSCSAKREDSQMVNIT